MKRRFVLLGGLALVGLIAGGAVYRHWNRAAPVAALAVHYLRTLSLPAGTIQTETAASGDAGVPLSPATAAAEQTTGPDDGDWPSYNKTLTSNRFSRLSQINRDTVGRLKVLCVYDTGQYTGFTSGLIEVNGALIGTTAFDIFSLDPADCRQNWRTHEDYPPATPANVNRGAAYLDGKLFRGTQDGRVLAYDFSTGRRLWATTVADPSKGETVPAAPIAWNGLVFVGNAGGDFKGVKGRMYALDADSGRIVWEFYLVPKSDDDAPRGPQGATPLDMSTWKNAPGSPVTGGATWTSYTLDPATGLLYVPGGNPAPDFTTAPREGENLYSGSVIVLDARTGAYANHIKVVPRDWHDWDVSSPPALIRTRGGRTVLSVAPKDGHLYGFDPATNALLYRTPATRIANADVPFSPEKGVHFCPGSLGGSEWNGPAYDPGTNLVLIGEVDWCTWVTLQTPSQIQATRPGQPWSGQAGINPFDTWGSQDPVGRWAGWVHAIDADTGAWTWRAKTNYPILSGLTPTAGGIVLFGDMGGNFYALDAANGRTLWGGKIGGAIGGGVITYLANGTQKIAVAAGLTAVLWPTEITTAKVVILGLE